MPKRMRCDICRGAVSPHAHYVVRIDVFADPSMPAVSADELAEMDPDATFEKLLDEMKHMSADELQDQVHRRFEYKLCADCQKQFLRNPLGMPRKKTIGKN